MARVADQQEPPRRSVVTLHGLHSRRHTHIPLHTHTYTRTARGYLRGVTAQMVLYVGEAQLAKGLPLFVQNSYGVKEDRMCRL